MQDSVSFSRLNVVRGLHGDPEMSKLVQVLRGEVWDVIVDARRGSPTYGKWESFELSDRNNAQLYIPRGFLHGFLARSDEVVFTYKQSAFYTPGREIGVRWDDSTLAIAWPLNGEPVISARDRSAAAFSDLA